MTKEQIEIKIKEILSHPEFIGWNKPIENSFDLRDYMALDELDLVELCISCEEKFEIIFNEDDWFKCKTVQDVIDLVHKHKEK